MYSRSVSSFCVELSSCRVGGCRVGPPPETLGETLSDIRFFFNAGSYLQAKVCFYIFCCLHLVSHSLSFYLSYSPLISTVSRDKLFFCTTVNTLGL